MVSEAAIMKMRDIYLEARELSEYEWQTEIIADPEMLEAASTLIWEADGRYCVPAGAKMEDVDGNTFEVSRSVKCAYTVYMDAEEIIRWRQHIDERNIAQVFRQIREPVVLQNGILPGKRSIRKISGKEDILYLRYRKMALNLSYSDKLKAEGFRFVLHSGDRGRRAVVNIITPAGIFLKCGIIYESADLVLDGFYMYEDADIAKINHTIAVLEECLWDRIMANDDMLLPHVAAMDAEQQRQTAQQLPEKSRVKKLISYLQGGNPL